MTISTTAVRLGRRPGPGWATIVLWRKATADSSSADGKHGRNGSRACSVRSGVAAIAVDLTARLDRQLRA